MVSKYLLVIHDDSAADPLGRWFDARRSPESERWTTRLNRTFSLTVVAPGVRDRISGKSFATGIAVASARGTVGVGSDVLSRGRRDRQSAGTLAGSFVRASWNRDEVLVEHDLFGSVPLFQAHGPGFVALSDSLLVLTDLRARFGLVNTPDAEVLLARSGLTSRTAQHLSTASMVREITMVPPAQQVVITCTRPLLVETVGESFASRVATTDEPLAALRRTAGFLVGALRALGEREDTALRVSGGRDSEVLLRALVRGGRPGNLGVETDRDGDVDGATALVERYGATVHAAEEPGPRGDVRGWAASALGTSDVLLATDLRSDVAARGRIVADGIGAKILRNPWGRQTAAQMAEVSTADLQTADAVAAQLRRGLKEIGADPDDPSAARLHYAAFRSGVHGAPASTGHGLPFHPLQTLESVAAVPLDVADTQLDPHDALAELLGDQRHRVSPDAEVGARSALTLSELGGPLDDGEVPDVVITGDAHGVSSSTELALEIAAVRGFTGDERPGALAETASDVLEVVPVPVREVYEPLVANARWQALERGVPLHEAGPSLAKLLSLAIFTA